MALIDRGVVWLANGDGSRPLRIVEGSTADWSPDSKRLAFDHGGRLWVMNRDASGLRRLPIDVPKCQSCFESGELSPDWSPNGHTLAFVHGEREPGSFGSSSVWVADVDGQNLRLLAAGGENPGWSPDGTKIAFLWTESHYDPVPQVRVIDANGSHERSYGFAERFSWAPHGAFLAYETGGSPPHVYVMRIGRGKQSRVDLKGAASPSWAPDGGRIAYQRRGSIYVTNLFTLERHRLLRGIEPSWSPDGLLIAYAGATCAGQQGIQLVGSGGRRRKQLTHACAVKRG